ncbi:MAG: MoaD/ThiS family protein [Dehalococcoidia bacterium]|nr:MoaD/ThiS family protein [Dehalococcoidia bacterium]
MPIVFIPSLLRELTAGATQVRVEGKNLRELLENLEAAHPGMKERLTDDSGRIRPEIVAAIDGETEHLGLLEPLQADTEIHFIPAIGGGDGDDGVGTATGDGR